MINLLIRMERNGKQVSIGNISGNGVSDACFAYEKTYLNGESPIPISLHLPLQEKPDYIIAKKIVNGIFRLEQPQVHTLLSRAMCGLAISC